MAEVVSLFGAIDTRDETDKRNQRNKRGEGSERRQSTLIRRRPGSAGSALWGALGRLLEDNADLFLESRQIPFYHRPDFRQVNAELVMDQHMAHFDDLWPRDLLMGLAKGGSELTCCLADDLDVVNHPGVDEFIILECTPPSPRISLNPHSGIEDIPQSSAIFPHKAIASLRTSFQTGGRSPRSDATSTGCLSKRSRSRIRAA